jgi:4-amino-4-deoxy-L-arabinose transferase-like glycosyltransferase
MSATTNGQTRRDMAAIIAASRNGQAWPWLALALATHVAFRLALLWAQAVPFNSDEAVVALMARHILQGERPIFFYGQAYMGSLDAWLVAGAFRLLGESVFAVRAVQIALYGGFIASAWIMARRWFTDMRVAVYAVWLAALPPVLVTTYTTASLGGYGESLLFGNLILWLGWEVTYGGRERSLGHWLAVGLIGGLAFWTLGLAGVFLLPVGLIGLARFQWKRWPHYLGAALAFGVGSAPWWWHNLNHDWSGLLTLLGVEVGGIATRVLSPVDRVLGFALLGVPAVLGLRPPWSVEYLPWPMLLVMVMGYTLVAACHLWCVRRGQPAMAPGVRWLLWLLPLALTALLIGTRFGTDSTGRYFLPLFIIVLLAAASALATARPALGALGLLVFLSVNVFGNVRAAQSPDRLTTQFDPITRWDNEHDAEVMDFLVANQLTRGYSNYWVSFRLAFLSREAIQYSAALPYKLDLSYNPADNRYLPYARATETAGRVAYITTLHPALNERLRAAFAAQGVTFREKLIGPYAVFYDLSRVVRPEELFGDSAFR